MALVGVILFREVIMDRYYIYVDWKDGEITEGYFVAKDKQDAVNQALRDCEDRSQILDVCVFKEMRNIRW